MRNAKFETDPQTSCHTCIEGVCLQDLEELGDDVDGAPERFTKPDMCLVLCSTYGDGEPPDTAMKFFDWLKEQADVCSCSLETWCLLDFEKYFLVGDHESSINQDPQYEAVDHSTTRAMYIILPGIAWFVFPCDLFDI